MVTTQTKPNPVKAKVSRKLAVPDTIQETGPPIELTDSEPSLDYSQILKDQGKARNPIKPVNHRKPISKDITCPHCGAPYNRRLAVTEIELCQQ